MMAEPKTQYLPAAPPQTNGATDGVAIAESPRVLATGLSFEEFLKWEGQERHVEWVNGNIIAMTSISTLHQRIGMFLMFLMVSWVEHHELGEIFCDPFVMRAGPDLSGRAPDILFLANENLHRLRENYLDGPADLVVEIVSPGSTHTDRQDKLLEYERGGVREYWLIDLPRREALFYERANDGFYRLAALENDVYHSKVLEGFHLQVEWLWQEPLPKPTRIVKEWKLI